MHVNDKFEAAINDIFQNNYVTSKYFNKHQYFLIDLGLDIVELNLIPDVGFTTIMCEAAHKASGSRGPLLSIRILDKDENIATFKKVVDTLKRTSLFGLGKLETFNAPSQIDEIM